MIGLYQNEEVNLSIFAQKYVKKTKLDKKISAAGNAFLLLFQLISAGQ
jgi:hypothetical protein